MYIQGCKYLRVPNEIDRIIRYFRLEKIFNIIEMILNSINTDLLKKSLRLHMLLQTLQAYYSSMCIQ